MHKKQFVFIGIGLIFFSSLCANLLLEKPKSLTNEQINELVESWNTRFTWKWVNIVACSFCYEKEKAGFALKCLGFPFYIQGKYRLWPTLHELEQLFHYRGYYFAKPLKYKKAN